MLEEIEQPDPIIIRPSRGNRLGRSEAARSRRRSVKQVKHIHQYKLEKDAKDRIRAKRRLEAQKRRARKKIKLIRKNA
jgi:hypothetical protein